MNYIGIISLTSSYLGLLVFSTMVRPDSKSFRQTVKSEIDKKADDFAKCFQGEPHQSIDLAWAIQSNGQLVNLKVRKSTLGKKETNCFLTKIKKMTFPRPPSSGIVTMTHTFESVKVDKKKVRKKKRMRKKKTQRKQ